MADKIVTDNILQKATEGIIQLIADNIFEFESYNDTEIAELFSLTPEEAQHISDLIADTVISQYKLWSSKKVSDELLSAKNECNDYTDDRLSGISSISLKYCEELPDVGESNCIYILKSTDSNPDTLNLYDSDNTTWISIGDFNISLDDVYKKSEVDTKLDLKADKTEILAQDDVLTDISLATTTNVLSATTTIEELDKKVDKTSIVTSISSTSTDDTVPSAKAVYDNVIKDNNIKTFTTLEQLGLVDGCTVEEIFVALPNDSYLEIACHTNSLGSDLNYVQNVPIVDGDYGILSIRKKNRYRFAIEYKLSGGGAISKNELYIGNLKGIDGTGLTWKRVCTTSVADVPLTKINTFNSTGVTGDVQYEVKNGICVVKAWGISSITNNTWLDLCTLPKAKTDIGNSIVDANGDGTIVGFVYVEGTMLRGMFYGSANYGHGSFSYSVAES